MAPSTHLQWTRIDKFKGLWDKGAPISMPGEFAQVMSGCHPQPNGGLRAFFKPRPFSTTQGLYRDASNPAVVSGFYVTPNSLWDFHVLTSKVSTAITTDVMRTPNANTLVRGASANSSSWSSVATSIPTTDPAYAFELSHTAPLRNISGASGGGAGSQYTVLRNAVDSLENDLYLFNFSGLQEQNAGDTFWWNFLCAHQSRLVGAYGSSVVFSSPGVEDFTAASADPSNFINLAGGTVSWMIPYPPNDLIVGTEDGAIFNIQGDLDDPTVRTLVNQKSGLFHAQIAVLTAFGGVATGRNGPFVIGPDGGTRQLATSLDEAHWWVPDYFGTEHGMVLCFDEGYLFCKSDGLYLRRAHNARIDLYNAANPSTPVTYDDAIPAGTAWPTDHDEWQAANELETNGLLVHDFATDSWFMSAHPDVAEWPSPYIVASLQGATNNVGQTIGISSGEIPAVARPLGYSQDTAGMRASVWEWKSAPLRTNSGREVKLQSVQFGAYGHVTEASPDNVATVTITATAADGTQRTQTVDITGGRSDVYTVEFKQLLSAYVDVSLKADSGDTLIEAPTLEYFSFGWTEGAVIHR